MIQTNLTKQKGCISGRTFFGIVLVSVFLSACGGEQSAIAPRTKLLSTGVQTGVAATTAPKPNLQQTDPGNDDPYEPPPASPIHVAPNGIRYIVEAPFISQVPLRIVVGAGTYAELCLYHDVPQSQLCVTIDSPLPAGMDLEYTDAALLDPGDDPRFLSFVPVIGNSDPQGLAASRFIDALGKAAAVWSSYLATHPQLVHRASNAFRASGASNLLLTGTARPPRSTAPGRIANSEGCYAEMAALGLCSPEPDNPVTDPNIPVVEVPRHLPPPDNSPPSTTPSPELPPYESPDGGNSGGSGQPPIGRYPKDGLLAQVTPVAKPCGKLGIGGLLCSITIFGKKPPPLPATVPEPIDHGHQYFAPQILCDWHILCNVGQEPRDNDRGPNSGTSGKTQAELDQICVDINIREIQVCYAIVKAKGRKGQDFNREVEMCKQEANDRMFACFETAKRLTDNGAHPAP
ncbi:hypothetical protein [Massilia sp.]|uniref:hypothetical protein n=1 Tax=Massilia sp. TaxID=1882437 RepID=UPI00352C2D3E